MPILTRDFRRFERFGVIMPPEDKDEALLPRRINGYWAMIHRPVTSLGAHMWISFSPDLRHWGSHKIILEARRGGWWDANKIGLCSPPIETSKGCLTIYHGVRHTASGSIYRLGLALFDLDRPDVCLKRGDSWMFGPEALYERSGDVSDVVFPCGQTIGADDDTIYLYYGAADSYMAMATGSVRSLLAWLDSHCGSDGRTGCDTSERTIRMNTAGWKRPTWLPHLLLIRHACPRCTSIEFKPAEPHSPDGLLSLFALRPFRCIWCWRRYYWFTFHGANAG
jgi:hypothetical protein